MQKQLTRTAIHQQKKKSQGLCVSCNLPRINSSHCAFHREKKREYVRNRARRVRLAEKERKSASHKQSLVAKAIGWIKSLFSGKEKAKCYQPSKELTAKSKGPFNHSHHYEARKANKQCIRCGEPSSKGVYCDPCGLKSRANAFKNSRKKAGIPLNAPLWSTGPKRVYGEENNDPRLF